MAKPLEADKPVSLHRILHAMSYDTRVSEAEFRIAFRIAQTVNEKTGWGYITDRTLLAQLPRTDKKKLRLFRRQMEALGWMQTKAGARGKATSYRFLPDNVEEQMDRADAAATASEAAYHVAKIQERTALQSLAMAGRFDPETGEITPAIGGKFYPLMKRRMGGKRANFPRSNLPPLLPQTSTSYPSTGTVQDMEQGAHARDIDDDLGCLVCGKPSAILSDGTRDNYCPDHQEQGRKRSEG
jgi:hypothetical protein